MSSIWELNDQRWGRNHPKNVSPNMHRHFSSVGKHILGPPSKSVPPEVSLVHLWLPSPSKCSDRKSGDFSHASLSQKALCVTLTLLWTSPREQMKKILLVLPGLWSSILHELCQSSLTDLSVELMPRGQSTSFHSHTTPSNCLLYHPECQVLITAHKALHDLPS